MATKVKRANGPREAHDESRDAARATPAGAPSRRRAPVALRVAASGRDSAPVRAEPRDTTSAPPPARRQGGARKQFSELREALSGGWEIVQPVFARPLWSAADDSQTAYSFVLKRETATRLVTVPGGRMVERFIATRHLAVDERH